MYTVQVTLSCCVEHGFIVEYILDHIQLHEFEMFYAAFRAKSRTDTDLPFYSEIVPGIAI